MQFRCAGWHCRRLAEVKLRILWWTAPPFWKCFVVSPPSVCSKYQNCFPNYWTWRFDFGAGDAPDMIQVALYHPSAYQKRLSFNAQARLPRSSITLSYLGLLSSAHPSRGVNPPTRVPGLVPFYPSKLCTLNSFSLPEVVILSVIVLENVLRDQAHHLTHNRFCYLFILLDVEIRGCRVCLFLLCLSAMHAQG